MPEKRLTPDRSPVGRRRTASLAVALVATALSSVLAAASASATENIYDSERVLRHHDNECVGQQSGDCITVASPDVRVPNRQAVAVTVACTAAYPYLVGWDSRQHEHIRVDLLSTPPGDRVTKAATGPESLQVVATSHVNARGYVRIFAGCSRQPWAGTPFMSFREAVPGNHVGYTGGKP